MTFLKEKKWVAIFLFLNAVATLRVFSELAFFDYEFKYSLYQNLRFFIENDYYFLIGAFTVPALIRRFTRGDYPKLVSLTAKLFPLIILAPWVDHFLVGRTSGYENAEVTPGILLQVVLIIGSASIYTLLKTREFLTAAFAGLCTYLLLWFFAMPEFIFSPQLDFASDIFLQFYYFVPFFIGALFFFKANDPESYSALMKALNPRNVFAGLVTAAGGAFVIYYSGYRVHQLHVIHVILLVFLLRSMPLRGAPVNASVLIAFVALSFAFTLGMEAFFLSLPALALNFLGELPERRDRIRSGALAVLSFFIAVFASSYVRPALDGLMAAWAVFFFLVGARVRAFRKTL